MAARSLAIDDEDFSFSLLPEIERSFDIKLADEELRAVVTLGDLHSLICRSITLSGGPACGSSVTYYRLRRLVQSSEGTRLTPETLLSSLSLRSPRRLKKMLERSTGMVLPGLFVGWPAGVGCIGIVACALTAWFLANVWPVAIGLPIMVVLIRMDSGVWLGSWNTLGSLARETAALNYAQLVRGGARTGAVESWRALTQLVEPFTPETTPAEMTPDMRLLR